MAVLKVVTEADHQIETAIAQFIGGQGCIEFLHIDDHWQVGEVEVLQQPRQYQQFEVLRRANVEGDGF
ncbi:hypothetical protein D3C84_1005250 [compost metagenome]